MGQVLSEPVRDKHSDSGKDEQYIFGTSSMQGWRVTMEDAHACELDLRKVSAYPPEKAVIEEESEEEAKPASATADDTTAETKPEELEAGLAEKSPTEAPTAGPSATSPPETSDSTESPKVAFFGVYDGHGGTTAAAFCGENLHRILVTMPAFKSGKYRIALKDTFLAADRLVKGDPAFLSKPSGSTATAILVSEDTIYVANAGDSRTILSINGKAKPMSFDHKPTDPGEQTRVEQAGGRVKDGRVNEHLALSRAIGDFDFKNDGSKPESQPVSVFPDITNHRITDEVEFIVLACDGIWDCKTSQEVIDYVRKGIADKLPLDKICESIMDDCLSEDFHASSVGCDNMTITIVGLLRGKTPEEWYDGISQKVSQTEAVTVALEAPAADEPAVVEVV